MSLTVMTVREERRLNGFLVFGLARREDASKLRAVGLNLNVMEGKSSLALQKGTSDISERILASIFVLYYESHLKRCCKKGG